MTITADRSTHASWCTAHVDSGPEVGPVGWCRAVIQAHGVEMEIVNDVEELGGATGVEVYAPGGTYFSPGQAREVAHSILTAADKVDGEGLVAFSVRDAAAKTGASEYEIRNAINKGEISAKRIGQRLIIPAGALASWIESLEDFPTA